MSVSRDLLIRETDDIAVKLILENKKHLEFSENDLTKFFHFATSETHFYVDGKIFCHVHGIEIGSPLGPEDFLNFTVVMWTIFVLLFFENELRAQTFLKKIQHPNLNFTIRKEHMKQLIFLYILNTRSEELDASIYRKSTFTRLSQIYNNFVPFAYKKGPMKTLTDLTFCLNYTWIDLHLDPEMLQIISQKSEFPAKLFGKSVSRYLSKNIINKCIERDIVED